MNSISTQVVQFRTVTSHGFSTTLLCYWFLCEPQPGSVGGCGVRGRYTESRESAREIASLYSWIYIALLEPGICQPAATSRQNCQPAGNISVTNWNFELSHIKDQVPWLNNVRCTILLELCYLHPYCHTDYGLDAWRYGCRTASPTGSYSTCNLRHNEWLQKHFIFRSFYFVQAVPVTLWITICAVYLQPASLHISLHMYYPTLHINFSPAVYIQRATLHCPTLHINLLLLFT